MNRPVNYAQAYLKNCQKRKSLQIELMKKTREERIKRETRKQSSKK